jgi:hypothetical protein
MYELQYQHAACLGIVMGSVMYALPHDDHYCFGRTFKTNKPAVRPAEPL